jgi:2-dehydropantoate 2-reductase
VLLVARGAHRQAIADHGLQLSTATNVVSLPVPSTDGPPDELRADDVLVLAVKTQDTVAALDAWAGVPVAGGGTAGERIPVVCAQNAVENERLALRRFSHVYGICVWLPSTYLEPGVVSAPCEPLTGILTLGRYPHGVDTLAEEISAALEKSNFAAPVVADVMRWKYGKLLNNLGNSLEALVSSLDSPKALDLYYAARAEGELVLAAAGIPHSSEEERAELQGDRMKIRGSESRPPAPGAAAGPAGSLQATARQGGSSWQSLTRGTGTIESDYLNGEIVLLGRQYGIPTPVNHVLQKAANQAARQGLQPGAMTPEEIAGEIAEARQQQ